MKHAQEPRRPHGPLTRSAGAGSGGKGRQRPRGDSLPAGGVGTGRELVPLAEVRQVLGFNMEHAGASRKGHRSLLTTRVSRLLTAPAVALVRLPPTPPFYSRAHGAGACALSVALANPEVPTPLVSSLRQDQVWAQSVPHPAGTPAATLAREDLIQLRSMRSLRWPISSHQVGTKLLGTGSRTGPSEAWAA